MSTKSNKGPESSAPRAVPPIPPKPEPRPEIVHQGKIGGPGSDTAQQRGWKNVGKF